jgi:hypothetical protein
MHAPVHEFSGLAQVGFGSLDAMKTGPLGPRVRLRRADSVLL